jgi:uncharacterized protein (UPF0335 family)
MARWHSFGRTHTKSLSELKNEVEKLKEAEKNIKSYSELQQEKEKIMSDIKKEGFNIRHKKALAIINKSESIGRNIGYGLKVCGKKFQPYAHRYLKKRGSKLSRYI